MARPKNTIDTKTKTISVLTEDERYIQENGLIYRHIVSLGIQAHRNGWAQHKEDAKIQELQTRISKFALTLDVYARRFEKLCVVVESGLNVKIKEDLSNIEELENKISEVYKEGEQ
jgi:nitrate reductase NapAB chaperone NapD